MVDTETGGNGAATGESAMQEPSSEAEATKSEALADGAKSDGKAEALVETIESKIARLEKERTEAHDRMLRIAAEFENWKKRSRREAEEAGARGREQLAKEILPVLDNLERALSAVGAAGGAASVESLGQGVKLVDKQLHGVLEKFEIKSFESLGEPFDPSKHEAIQQMETTEFPAGNIARVFARGYLIGARLLRPAMVAVAKQPPSVTAPDAAENAEPVEIETVE